MKTNYNNTYIAGYFDKNGNRLDYGDEVKIISTGEIFNVFYMFDKDRPNNEGFWCLIKQNTNKGIILDGDQVEKTGITKKTDNVVVSLTSWKKRIDVCYKTITSILFSCNPAHIVLTLSTEEFPNGFDDMPFTIKTLVKANKLEIIFIKENLFCYKKILFAMQKYKDLPIVSADDDCIYIEDYVGKLYEKWLTDKKSIWTYKRFTYGQYVFAHGPAALYPPNCFGDYGVKNVVNPKILITMHDDIFYAVLAKKLGIEIKQVLENNSIVPYCFHNNIDPLSNGKSINTVGTVLLCEQEIKI